MFEITNSDFQIQPVGFQYGTRTSTGYLSIHAILQRQADSELYDFVVNLKTRIAQRCDRLAIRTVDTPHSRDSGIYLYPDSSLHCTFFEDKAQRKPSFDMISKMDVSHHPWLSPNLSSLEPIRVIPRWFFASNQDHCGLTEGFSLQLFLPLYQFEALYACFGKCPKLYPSAHGNFVRGVINLARFLPGETADPFDIANPFDIGQTTGLNQLFQELNVVNTNREYKIDKLNLVKSDAWLYEWCELREFTL